MPPLDPSSATVGAFIARWDGNGQAERANLTLRMGSRRFTRLTNAFSKKVENHAHSVAIHTMHYNFVRSHLTLRCTPAMAAGVTASLWELADIVKVIEAWEANH